MKAKRISEVRFWTGYRMPMRGELDDWEMRSNWQGLDAPEYIAAGSTREIDNPYDPFVITSITDRG